MEVFVMYYVTEACLQLLFICIALLLVCQKEMEDVKSW